MQSNTSQYDAASTAEMPNANRAFFLLLLTYLFLSYFRPQIWLPFLELIRPGLLVGGLLCLYSLFGIKDAVSHGSRVVCILLFLGECMLSVPFAVNNFWAFTATQSLALHVLAIVIPMVLLLDSEHRLRVFIQFFVLLNVYVAIYAITHAGKGPGSFIRDENDVALALNVALPFAFFLRSMGNQSAFRKFFWNASTALLVVGIVFTFSRGGFVGLIAVVASIIFLTPKKVRNVLIVVLAAVALVSFAPEEYLGEMKSISDDQDKTRTGRLYQWEMGWYMYLDNPLLGVGAGNYPWRVSEYEIESGKLAPNARLHGGRAAHSFYFTLIPEHGTVGVVLFIVMTYVSVISMWRLRRRIQFVEKDARRIERQSFAEISVQATLCALVGFLSSSLFISTLYYPQFWLLVALSCALTSVHGRAFQ